MTITRRTFFQPVGAAEALRSIQTRERGIFTAALREDGEIAIRKAESLPFDRGRHVGAKAWARLYRADRDFQLRWWIFWPPGVDRREAIVMRVSMAAEPLKPQTALRGITEMRSLQSDKQVFAGAVDDALTRSVPTGNYFWVIMPRVIKSP